MSSITVNDPRHKSTKQGVRNPDLYQNNDIDKFLKESKKFVQKNNEYNTYLRSGNNTGFLTFINPEGTPVNEGYEGLGYSGYDTNTLTPGYTDLEDVRDDEQGNIMATLAALGKFTNKAVTTSYTTLMSLLGGTIFGVKALIEGRPWEEVVNKALNNELTEIGQRVDEYFDKEVFPIYRRRSESAASLFSTENLLSEGFLGQLGDVFGFAKGAQISTKLAFKALTGMNMGTKTAMLSSSLIGSLGEASIEATHAAEEFKNAKIAELKKKTDEELLNVYNNLSLSDSDKKLQIAQISNKYEQDLAQIEKNTIDVGNLTGLLNMIILTPSNFLAYAQPYASKGYREAKRAYNTELRALENAKKAGKITEDTYNMRRALLGPKEQFVEGYVANRATGITTTVTNSGIRASHNETIKGIRKDIILESIGREAGEEMSQMIASETAKSFEDDQLLTYYTGGDQKKGWDNAVEFLKTLLKTSNELLGQEQFWYEGMLGALVGAFGSPTFKTKGDSNSSEEAPKGWRRFMPEGFSFEGNVFSQHKKGKEKIEKLNQLVQEINDKFSNNKVLQEGLLNIRDNLSLEEAKAKAIQDGDIEAYERAELAQSIKNAVFAHRRGIFPDLEEYYSKLSNISESEAVEVAKQFTQQEEDGKFVGDFTDGQGNMLEGKEIQRMLKEFGNKKLQEIASVKNSVRMVDRLYQGTNDEVRTESVYLFSLLQSLNDKISRALGNSNEAELIKNGENTKQSISKILDLLTNHYLKNDTSINVGDSDVNALDIIKNLKKVIDTTDAKDLQEVLHSQEGLKKYFQGRFLHYEDESKYKEAVNNGEEAQAFLSNSSDAKGMIDMVKFLIETAANSAPQTQGETKEDYETRTEVERMLFLNDSDLSEFFNIWNENSNTVSYANQAVRNINKRLSEILQSPQQAEEEITNRQNNSNQATNNSQEEDAVNKYINSKEFENDLRTMTKDELVNKAKQKGLNIKKFLDAYSKYLIDNASSDVVKEHIVLEHFKRMSLLFFSPLFDDSYDVLSDSEKALLARPDYHGGILIEDISYESGFDSKIHDFLLYLASNFGNEINSIIKEYIKDLEVNKLNNISLSGYIIPKILNGDIPINSLYMPTVDSVQKLKSYFDFLDKLYKDIQYKEKSRIDSMQDSVDNANYNKNNLDDLYNRRKGNNPNAIVGVLSLGAGTRGVLDTTNQNDALFEITASGVLKVKDNANDQEISNIVAYLGSDPLLEKEGDGDIVVRIFPGRVKLLPNNEWELEKPIKVEVKPATQTPTTTLPNGIYTLNGISQYSVDDIVNNRPTIRNFEEWVNDTTYSGELKSLFRGLYNHLLATNAFSRANDLSVGDEVRFTYKDIILESGRTIKVLILLNSKNEPINVIAPTNYIMDVGGLLSHKIEPSMFYKLIELSGNIKEGEPISDNGKIVTSKINSLGESTILTSKREFTTFQNEALIKELVKDSKLELVYLDNFGIVSTKGTNSSDILNYDKMEKGIPYLLFKIPKHNKYRAYPTTILPVSRGEFEANQKIASLVTDIHSNLIKGMKFEHLLPELAKAIMEVAYLPDTVEFRAVEIKGEKKFTFSLVNVSPKSPNYLDASINIAHGLGLDAFRDNLFQFLGDLNLPHKLSFIEEGKVKSVSNEELAKDIVSYISHNIDNPEVVNTGFAFDPLTYNLERQKGDPKNKTKLRDTTSRPPSITSRTETATIGIEGGRPLNLTIELEGDTKINSMTFTNEFGAVEEVESPAKRMILDYLYLSDMIQKPNDYMGLGQFTTDSNGNTFYSLIYNGIELRVHNNTIMNIKYNNIYETIKRVDLDIAEDISDLEGKIKSVLEESKKLSLNSDSKGYTNSESGISYLRVSDIAWQASNSNNSINNKFAAPLGTVIDNYVRDIIKSSAKHNISLIEALKKSRVSNTVKEIIKPFIEEITRLENAGYVLVKDNVSVFSDELGIAGTLDILMYNPSNSRVLILDMKTHRAENKMEADMKTNKYYRNNPYHNYQLTMYKEILAKSLGIPIGNISVNVLGRFLNYSYEEGTIYTEKDIKNSITKGNVEAIGDTLYKTPYSINVPTHNHTMSILRPYLPTPSHSNPDNITLDIEDEEDNQDDYFRVENDEVPFKRIDLNKELRWLSKVLPQLTVGERIKVVEGLIKARTSNGLVNVWGVFNGSMITLSDNAAEGTLYHEAFHYVFQTLLSKGDREELLDSVRQEGLSNIQLEEILAEDFRRYVQDREEGSSIFSKLKRKLRYFIDTIKNWVGISNQAERLFYSINEGVLGDREIFSLEEEREYNLFSGNNSDIVMYNGSPTRTTMYNGNITDTYMFDNSTLFYANDLDITIVNSLKEASRYSRTKDGVYVKNQGLVLFDRAKSKIITSKNSINSSGNTNINTSIPSYIYDLGIPISEYIRLSDDVRNFIEYCYS